MIEYVSDCGIIVIFEIDVLGYSCVVIKVLLVWLVDEEDCL